METSIGRAAPLGLMLALFAVPGVSAQERCKISWDTSASEAKYTQQLALDVGDVPGRQIRVFELHRTYLNDKPNCEGLKRAELWDHTFTDYVNRNGPWRGYAVVTMNTSHADVFASAARPPCDALKSALLRAVRSNDGLSCA